MRKGFYVVDLKIDTLGLGRVLTPVLPSQRLPHRSPPLRAREDDIALLLEYFIDRFARQAGKKIKSIDKKTLELVQAYPWPGNISELQNVIERSVVLCDTEIFSVDESWLSRTSSSLESSNTMLSKRPAL